MCVSSKKGIIRCIKARPTCDPSSCAAESVVTVVLPFVSAGLTAIWLAPVSGVLKMEVMLNMMVVAEVGLLSKSSEVVGV